MKLIISAWLILSVLPAFSQAEYRNKQIDTLRIIEAKKLKNRNIKYVTDKNEIVFSKSVTIKVLCKLLAEMKAELDTAKAVTDWKLEYYQQHEKVLKYIEAQKTLTLSNAWENDTIQNYEQIENNISLLTAQHFHELACEMFDTGNFYLKKDGKQQRKIVKAEVFEWDKYSGTTSIKYLLPDGEEIWECPPITIAHYETD